MKTDGNYSNISLARAKQLPGARLTGKTSSAEFTIPVDELGMKAFTLKYDSTARTLNAKPSEVMAAISGNMAVMFDGEGVVAPMKWQVTNGQFLVLWADVDYPNVDYKQVKVQAYLPDDAWTIGAEGGPVSHEGSKVAIDMTGAAASALANVTEGMDGKVVVLENLPASVTALTIKVAANVAVVDVTLPLGTDLTTLSVVDESGVPLYVANGSSGMPEDFMSLDRLQIVVENGVFYVRKVTNDALPPYTLRFRANKAVTTADFSGKAVTLHTIDDTLHIYDLYYNNADWAGMFAGKSWLVDVIDANLDGVTSVGGLCNGATNLETLKISSVKDATSFGGFFNSNLKLVSVYIGSALSVTSLAMFLNAFLSSLQSVFIECGSACTDFTQMCKTCTALKKVTISGDTSNVTSIAYMFDGCTLLKFVPLFDTPKVSNAGYVLNGCRKIERGALALYTQLSTKANPPTYYVDAFKDCGADTASGLAELQQIPTSWGGLA